ncbi:FtsQ-type POTRA domain-containing protein [Mycetocola lacteus]|uniref:FtsQ-type POTRA domain-containing protein n=1 Tax=Mycetocola lacteus TaxID=76637 RepID=A0A3L7ARU3_9MICO|nr:FtsQ-type POTRA domain-containing protein [Mycetocola lacteus]RLP82824.1 FtsQ-type POTRA domain-containing protein [Mycetocola lacteus]
MKRPSGIPHTPASGEGKNTRRPARDEASPVEPTADEGAANRQTVESAGESPVSSESGRPSSPDTSSTRDTSSPTGWVAEALSRARAAAGAQAADATAAENAKPSAPRNAAEHPVSSSPADRGGETVSARGDDEATQDLSALRAPTIPAGLSEPRGTDAPRREDQVAPAPERAAQTAREARRERKRFERAEVRRFTVRSRRRRRAWLIGLGSVAVVALLALIVSYTPILSVRKIEVRGTDRLSASALEHKLSGELGTPFPLVDQSAIKAVLTEFPLIESYRVESSPPSTLILRIVERTPVGVVAVDGGFELVDAAGVVIERTGEKPADYPVITVDRAKSMDAFRAAAAVLRAMPEDLRAKVSSIGATTRDDVTFGLVDSETVVLWGDASDGVVKAKLLEALMRAQPDAQRFNVTSPEIGVVG